MKTLHFVSVIVSLAVVSCGSAPSPVPEATSASPSASAAVRITKGTTVEEAWSQLCDGPESVPMEVAGSREFVSATLPGATSKEALRFHVDSGGNTRGLILRKSAADRLGFTSEDKLPRSISIGAHDIALPEGADWTISDDAQPGAKRELATRKDWSVGQIGAGFLSHFVVCIDPGKGKIGFGDPKKFNIFPKDENFIPLLMMPGGKNHALHPFVYTQLHVPPRGGQEGGKVVGGYGLLLDTGATTSMLDENKVDYQHKQSPDWGLATGTFGDSDMIGSSITEKVLRAPDVTIQVHGALLAKLGLKQQTKADLGATTFVSRPTGTWDNMFGSLGVTMGSHGALANDVLLKQALLIDYPNARLFLKPSGFDLGASASSSRIGVEVTFDGDGCPSVRGLTDTNDKDTLAKLQVDDVITAIDGEDACKLYHHQLSARLAGPPGTIKKLSLRRKGQPVDIEVKTAELLR